MNSLNNVDTNEKKKMIFVVGCPRSGTSLFSNLLVEHGLKTVEDKRSSKQYPKGYYEHMPLLMFHKALERLGRGADHRITKRPFLKEEYLEDDFIRQMFKKAFKPVRNRKIDFLKFPQLALSVDFLINHFENVHIVALWRKPCTVYKSLIKKEFSKNMLPISLIKAVYLWNMYAYHIYEAKRTYPEFTTILNIDDLIKKDASLYGFLRNMGYSNVSKSSISKVFDPSLWSYEANIRWKGVYFVSRLLGRRMTPFITREKAELINQKYWQKKLKSVTDSLEFN